MFLLRLFYVVALYTMLPPALAAGPAGTTAYGVGLRVEQYRDDARSFQGHANRSAGRPVQALVWYPAEPGGTPLQYGQYERYAATETDFTLTEAAMDRRLNGVIDRYARRMPRDQVEKEMRSPVLAVRGAVPANGIFPVVIYAASFSGRAHENAALCEYLASRGYIVVASASVGRQSVAMTDDADGVQTQAADIRFLIGKAASLPGADARRVGVAGFSWGGLSNVVAAGSDARIAALVSLDGSVRYYPELVKDNPLLRPERFATPLLYLAARPRTMEQLSRDKDDLSYSFINASRYADRYVVTMDAMLHGDFSEAAVRFMPDGEKPLHTRAELQEAHQWIYRYVSAFFDAYLRQDGEARAFLTRSPAANGIPRRLLFVDAHMADDVPPSR